MTRWSRSLRLSLLMATTTLAACGATGSAPPSQQVCNDISADMGGCTIPRHTYTSSSCADLAREWAGALGPALLTVLDGPPSAGGNGRSVRLHQELVIATADLNIRLRALNLQAQCDVPEFLATAEPLFPSRLRTGVGEALYDGNPVSTYDDWLDDVRRTLGVIDDDESPGPSGPPGPGVASPPA